MHAIVIVIVIDKFVIIHFKTSKIDLQKNSHNSNKIQIEITTNCFIEKLKYTYIIVILYWIIMK